MLELKSLKWQNQKVDIWVSEKNFALLVKSRFSIPSTPLAQKNIETTIVLYGNDTAADGRVQ